MIEKLRDIQRQNGAIMNESSATPTSFGNDSEALKATTEAVAVCDRSDWVLVKITGEDRLRFLHNQSTNDFNRLQAGDNCETVFVTSTARTIDLATVYVTKDEVLLLFSPSRREYLLPWMDRFIFPMDRVEIRDISTENVVFSLIGPKSQELLERMGLREIPTKGNVITSLGDLKILVALGNDLALPGYNLIMAVEAAGSIWNQLIVEKAVPMGTNLWEKLRICQGRPAAGQELTEEYNPLEAGLWQTISFNKGCYIGQETIARLNTYKGIKQKLWGINLGAPVEPGTVLTVEDTKVGVLTSCTQTETGFFGLGYIKTKAGGVGLKVKAGETTAEIVSTAFIKHLDQS